MYTDLLPRIKNAERAGNDSLLVPFSRVDFDIAKVLVEANYLGGVQKKMIGKKVFLEIKLAKKGKAGAISGVKIISKPSRHIYTDSGSIRQVKQGYGLGVISTSKGIMSDKEARKQKIGGEYLFEIW